MNRSLATPAAVLIAALVGARLCLSPSVGAYGFGVAALVWAALVALNTWREPLEPALAWWRNAATWAVPGLLVALGLVAYSGLLHAAIPDGEDHAVHLHHAGVMARDMLPRGQITGWSNLEFAGDPAFSQYAPGPYLLIAVLDLLGGPLVSLEGAYVAVLLLVLVGLPLSLYALLRAHGVGRGGAWLAGAFALLDKGIYNEGGWQQNVVDGVWPNTFCLLLVVLTLLALRRVLTGGGFGAALALVLATAATLLAHAVGFVYLAIVLPVYAAAFVRSRERLGTAALGLALGVGVAAFWLWPFLAMRDVMVPQGQEWLTLAEVGRRFLAGTLFGNLSVFAYVLGVAGMVVGFDRDRPIHRFGVALVAVVIAVASSNLWHTLGVTEKPGYQHINFARFLPLAKMAWFGFAGAALAALVSRPDWRRLLASPGWAFLGVAAAVQLLAPVGAAFKADIVAPMRALQPLARADYQPDVAAAFAWLRARKAEDDRFFRVIAVEPRGVQCAHLVPLRTGIPVTHLRGEPTFHYIYRFYDHRSEVLTELSVRYVLACRSPPKVEGVIKVWSSNDISIWELPGWKSDRFRVTGKAVVASYRVDDETMDFDVASAEPGAKLQVRVVGSKRWHARLDGQELPIELTGIPPSAVPFFMEVTLPGPGKLVFTYEMSGRQVAGIAVSVAALLALFAWALRAGLNFRRRRGHNAAG